MKFAKFLADLAIISKLGDNPGADNGLTSNGLKAKFDEAGLKIQTFINSLVDSLNTELADNGPIYTSISNANTAASTANAAADSASNAAAAASAAAERANASANALPITGGNMKGPIDMSGQSLSGLNAPTEETEAATKGYVDQKKGKAIATLPAAGWVDNAQTVAVEGMTKDYDIIVVAAPENYTEYTDANVRCTGQGEGTLTFACNDVPSVDLNTNVLILK